MKLFILIWRLLLAILAALLLFLPLTRWWLVAESERLPEVTPLVVAALDQNQNQNQNSQSSTVAWTIAARNPFTRTGEAWSIPPPPPPPAPPKSEPKADVVAAAAPAETMPNATSIHGVLQLPAMAGILTDKGFVPIGGQWGLARVDSLTDENILISYVAGKKELPIQPGRQERTERLKKFGLTSSWEKPL